MARPKSEIPLARLWPWIEKTAPRRFTFAVILGVLAGALQWLILPVTQGRVPFIFFVPAIVLASTLAGRWPGALVAVMGLTNSLLMKPGPVWITSPGEQLA